MTARPGGPPPAYPRWAARPPGAALGPWPTGHPGSGGAGSGRRCLGAPQHWCFGKKCPMTEEEKEHTCHSTAHRGPSTHFQPKKNCSWQAGHVPVTCLLAGCLGDELLLWSAASTRKGRVSRRLAPAALSPSGRTYDADALWLPFHPKPPAVPQCLQRPRSSNPVTPPEGDPLQTRGSAQPSGPRPALLMPHSPDTKAGLGLRGSPGPGPQEKSCRLCFGTAPWELRAQRVQSEEL